MAQRDFKGLWIPKEVWLSEELTLQEKVFYVEIDSLDNHEGCYANNEYFAKFFGISKVRVSEVINSLVEKGFITSQVDQSKGNKRVLNTLANFSLRPSQTNVVYPHKGSFKHSNTINNTVNSISDSEESVPKKPLSEESFQLSIEPQSKGRAQKVEKLVTVEFPEYGRFIEIWMDTYKTIGLRMPRDGRMIKQLIQQTRDILKERQVPDTPDNVCEFWEIFIKCLVRTWGHGKDLVTIESKYKTLIFDLENGKQKPAKDNYQSTRDFINNL